MQVTNATQGGVLALGGPRLEDGKGQRAYVDQAPNREDVPGGHEEHAEAIGDLTGQLAVSGSAFARPFIATVLTTTSALTVCRIKSLAIDASFCSANLGPAADKPEGTLILDFQEGPQ
jgi:hypothetical protein